MTSHSEKQKAEYKRLVIEAITEELKKPTSHEHEHEEVRVLAKGLDDGEELKLTVLTGGLCNYSYKLECKNRQGEGDTRLNDFALFVKLTFGSPLLFPDVECSLNRTEIEFKMMELFAKISPHPESVVTPYLYFDIKGGAENTENMKVIVTQFSSRLEEQAANVFIDGGVIDKDFATKSALGLSALHNEEVIDSSMNGEMKKFFADLTGIGDMLFAAYLDDTKDDRVTKRARAIGKEGLDQIMDEMKKSILRTDSYVHGDCHAFNMLVEGDGLALDNENGRSSDVAFIDWEFSHCGPIGKDIGFLNGFPIACAFAHALNGDKTSSESILEFVDTVWETYAESILLDGKDLSLEDVYRQVMGWFAVLIMAYGGIGLHMEYLPIEEDRTEDLARIKESLGFLSLECYEMGFLGLPEDATIEELRKRFRDAVQTELDLLAPTEEPRTISFSDGLGERRRSSLLRTTGRRVSDAHSYFGMVSDFDEEEASDLAFGSGSFSEMSAPSTSLSRSKQMSAMGKQRSERNSLSLIDLKRTSLTGWAKHIVNFDFDYEE